MKFTEKSFCEGQIVAKGPAFSIIKEIQLDGLEMEVA
jgi:hypothetical protein